MLDIDITSKSENDIMKIAKDYIFGTYRHLNFLYVNEDNEKAFIDKLIKEDA